MIDENKKEDMIQLTEMLHSIVANVCEEISEEVEGIKLEYAKIEIEGMPIETLFVGYKNIILPTTALYPIIFKFSKDITKDKEKADTDLMDRIKDFTKVVILQALEIKQND